MMGSCIASTLLRTRSRYPRIILPYCIIMQVSASGPWGGA